MPVFQNESSCKTFHIKMTWICLKINVLVKQKVPHEDSLPVLTEAKGNSVGTGLMHYLGGIKGAGERNREATSNSIHSSVT